MENKNKTNTRRTPEKITLIKAGAIFLIGLLFCLSTIWGTKTLSVILGVALIVEGVIFCALALSKEKTLLVPTALGGALSISFGVYVIMSNAVSVLFSLIPLVLIPFGALFLADAFLGKFGRKRETTALFVVKVVIGVIGITLGLCLLFVKGFGAYAALVLGLILIAFSLYVIIMTTAVKKSN